MDESKVLLGWILDTRLLLTYTLKDKYTTYSSSATDILKKFRK